MAIDVRDRKLLWGRAGNRCAFLACLQLLIEDSPGADDGAAILGREAHIVGQSDSGPRAKPEMPQADRDCYANLILLCPTHHDLIDADPIVWTITKLHAMKSDHERAMAPTIDAVVLRSDEAWAGLVDGLTDVLDLPFWSDHFSGFLSPHQGLRQSSLKRLYDAGAWLNARIFPTGHGGLKLAFLTVGNVIGDLVDTFEIYADAQESTGDDPYIFTGKFYKYGGWPNPNYHVDVEKYGRHVDLVADLALELCRAMNWLCDIVRAELDPLFLVETGALQLLGGPFEDGHTRWLRPEYSEAALEASAPPYADLERFSTERFSTERYSRDFHSPKPE